jgi:putative transposase
VRRLCALLEVTRAGYYAWRTRSESARRKQDRQMLEAVRRVFTRSRGTYGSPRVHRALKRLGWAVSRRRVERLMRTDGLRGRVARIYRANPGLHKIFEQHPNRLWKRRATRPDQVWVADVTYLAVGRQWRYLAVVMDQRSRRILGWSLGRGRGVSLTRGAFDGAVRRRHPRRGLIFHSDRGIEYAGKGMKERLVALGIRQSMTRAGCPGDNAHAESFFHSLKADVIHGNQFTNDEQLRSCLRSYIPFYNQERTHSSIGYLSPVEYESRVA